MTMDVDYVARNVSIPDRFRDYVREKFSKIEQLSQRAQSLEIKVTKEANHRHSDGNHTVELTVKGKGKIVRAEAKADDKFAAFDLAFAKLLERLRRLRDRRKDHRRQWSVAAATADLPTVDSTTPLADQILQAQQQPGESEDGVSEEAAVRIRHKVFPAQPMTADDAVDAMELVGHDFYLFIDADSGRPSAVYRRRGWSYGVISLDAEDPEAQPTENERGYRQAV